MIPSRCKSTSENLRLVHYQAWRRLHDPKAFAHLLRVQRRGLELSKKKVENLPFSIPKSIGGTILPLLPPR
jgi:hypothetical protein